MAERRHRDSARRRLAFSYAAVFVLVGIALCTAFYLFVVRYVPINEAVYEFFGVRTRALYWFPPTAAVVLVLLVVVGFVIGWFLAGRFLAPLTRITAATRKAATGSLSHRVELDGRDDEFGELAEAFDTMLARLEAQQAEQQRFAANASHELRTPLAVTRTLLDVARSDPARGRDELVEQLHAVNTRAIELTEALLLLSRAEQGAFAAETLDVSLLAEEAVETLLPLAEKYGVAIEVVGDPATAVGSPALLLQMVMNLLHNAIVHNLPEGGTVRIETTAEPGAALLTVENTGELLPLHRLATFTEPFQRGAGRTSGDHAGVGLGLAIVKGIVQAHGGVLDLAPRDDGGLRVSARIPVR